MRWHIRLLGGLEARPGSKSVISFPTRKAEALLAVLARHPGERHGREGLATFLWPDSPDGSARTNLRQTLKQLRKALAAPGEPVLLAEADTLALETSWVEVDVARFEQAHDRGTRAALNEAAGLYRGDFLAGITPPEEPFAEWVLFERMQLRERAVAVLAKLLPDDPADCDSDQAIQIAVRLLGIDPLQERIHRLLMRLYLEQGRRGAALEQYRFCRMVVRRDLGVEPEPETRTLYREVCRGQLIMGARDSAAGPRAAPEAVLDRPAVAVLPFTNLNGDPARAYFSDGVSEDVITALAGWRRFPLIASSSTLNCRSESGDVRRIADKLGALYIVAGSVRQAGKRARITVRLVDAESGHVLWTERYDLDADDILAAQGDCAEKIAAAVEPKLESAELSRIVTKRTEDLNAWDRFVQGLAWMNRFTTEGNAQARGNFQQAIDLDPGYSDAYRGVADCYLFDILLQAREGRAGGTVAKRAEQLTRAFEAAREAVRLDPDSSDAHLTLGHAHVWAEEFDEAMAETELAIELNPSNVHARRSLGNRLDLIGRTTDGIAQMERSLQLNPCDRRRWVQIGFLTRAHVDARHYEEALSWARRAVQLRPDQPDPHFRLAACLAHLGRGAEARDALQECERLRPGFVVEKSSWRPYSDPNRSAHFFAGLRRVGIATG